MDNKIEQTNSAASSESFLLENMWPFPLSPLTMLKRGTPLPWYNINRTRDTRWAAPPFNIVKGERGQGKHIIELLFDFIVHLLSKCCLVG